MMDQSRIAGTTQFPQNPIAKIDFSILRELARLTMMRSWFRVLMTVRRLRSPRRIVATSLTVLFILLYLVNGVFILSARQPADPDRLRLWLSGGMVLYVLYHAVRCAWSPQTDDLEWTPAESLWLGGGPIPRWAMAAHQVTNLIVPVFLKSLLLVIVLAIDVSHVGLLFIGIFCSLTLLELVRLMIARAASGVSPDRLRRIRLFSTAVAITLVAQVLARLISITAPGSSIWEYVINAFRALGATAASDTVQWLALPWITAANLAVTSDITFTTFVQLIGALSGLPLAVVALVYVDAYAQRHRTFFEQRRLARLARTRASQTAASSASVDHLPKSDRRRRVSERFPNWIEDAISVAGRQWVSVRRYWATILVSFLVPMALCLSPLMVGQFTQRWFAVVAGVALCTMLLAPPALKIDFRRDLRRMLLLRSLPMNAASMVLGQLSLPILITWIFQAVTLSIAAVVTSTSWDQWLMWVGLMAAWAVFTFALENALFLTYPHDMHRQGVMMMIRAKLTFLGKSSVIVGALILLVIWATFCRSVLTEQWVTPVFVISTLACGWAVALAAIWITTRCWRRFDVAADAT